MGPGAPLTPPPPSGGGASRATLKIVNAGNERVASKKAIPVADTNRLAVFILIVIHLSKLPLANGSENLTATSHSVF